VVAVVGWVVTPPPDGMVAGGAAVVEPTLVDVVEDDVVLDEVVKSVVAKSVVVDARAVVTGAWVATCCFGDVSLPVTTSKSKAVRATAARA
jgi:hypothetical protein